MMYPVSPAALLVVCLIDMYPHPNILYHSYVASMEQGANFLHEVGKILVSRGLSGKARDISLEQKCKDQPADGPGPDSRPELNCPAEGLFSRLRALSE